ncbi:sugar (glycoside-Pentoside-Hexuronide) transporter [Listeria weihenstephanensis FSL R9-0317]|uniref:Sodium:solute symporter n=1 Tax=Listeria weihenstephanensis TaxID=1006155 RepID=A0A1S7FQK1_9LIST|nr:MFS transporter [Listeria weihenstephanensis]AQY49684.1 sodium:solute symporter [Listeria weihenstephanensis]EUJ39619.1 sugar (glycoside-Pentoside-Hexuronide) transporter [Listeria weihenstephanensis FSL R9-0317]
MFDKQTSWKERISYGLSDTASNFVFAMISTYLIYFYTDVFGIGAATVGTLFLVTRCIDAFDGPVFGILIDRTNTRWGKSRPYFLWLAIPLAVVFVMTFTTPDLSLTGKTVYAYITYMTLSIMYSAINVPVTAILPSLSSSPKERTVIVTVRMIFAALGSAVVSICVLPMVDLLGQGDKQKGFFWTVVILAVFAVIFFFIAFKNVREKVEPISDKEKIEFKDLLLVMRKNRPWVVMVIFAFIYFLVFTIKMQSTMYYMTYNFGRPDLAAGILGVSTLSIVATICIPKLTSIFTKRTTMLVGLAIFGLGQLIVWISSGNDSVSLLFIGAIVGVLGLGLIQPVLFTMAADTVDYGEWKTGIRAQGFLSSAPTMGVKIGMGVGGAISGWLLSAGGYVPNQTQSASALMAIEWSYIWVPIIGVILAAGVMMFYNLDKTSDTMTRELEARKLMKEEK